MIRNTWLYVQGTPIVDLDGRPRDVGSRIVSDLPLDVSRAIAQGRLTGTTAPPRRSRRATREAD